MDGMYWIAWRAERTGATGHGSGIFPYEEAKRYADALNEQDRDVEVHHWAEASGGAPPERAKGEPGPN